jgi:hypothetical protein
MQTKKLATLKLEYLIAPVVVMLVAALAVIVLAVTGHIQFTN